MKRTVMTKKKMKILMKMKMMTKMIKKKHNGETLITDNVFYF